MPVLSALGMTGTLTIGIKKRCQVPFSVYADWSQQKRPRDGHIDCQSNSWPPPLL